MRFFKYLLRGNAANESESLALLIKNHSVKEKASIFAPHADKAFDDEELMKMVDTYGLLANVFFQNSKKILEEEYQHKILDYYFQEKPLTNLLHYLFWNRATVVKLGVWDRMIKDERIHPWIYSFFEELKKQSPEGWEKLGEFCKENKFDVPAPIELDSYVKIRQELFGN